MKKICITMITFLTLFCYFSTEAMIPTFFDSSTYHTCCCHQTHALPKDRLPDPGKLSDQMQQLNEELRLCQESIESRQCRGIISQLMTENHKMLNYKDSPTSDRIITIDKIVLEKALDIITGKSPCNSGISELVLWTLESQKVGISPKGEWFIPIEFLQKLNDLVVEKSRESERRIEERIARIEATCITSPDYAHPIVKKPYDVSISGEYVAEGNGWVFARAYSNQVWIGFEVNGQSITSGNGDFVFFGNAHLHGSIFYPVHKNDKYKLTGGSWHTVIFYPCLKID